MSGGYILVVDDEPAICDMIRTCLELAGFRVKLSANGHLAHQMIVNERPDLVIADWMMPMLSGIELTRRLKRDELTADIPVIMLTARADEDDRISGLDSGADDYILKPFSTRELIARIRAVLRRTNALIDDIPVKAGKLSLDRSSQNASISGQPVTLGPLEFRLLEFFMLHPNRVYSRAQLLDRVWGGNVYIDDRTVDVHIRRLRKALSIDDQEQMIQTVRGAGYRFSPSDEVKS
ncbi:MAG: phosphate regulon transcriptional regulatory protein PhoB [Oceanospirillaceae bacterium]|jgi:two-component system phosphate regulon response regulator PhoB|uniref:phosphate regulon transcriptional regulator PhoB n=1 Tax=Thalassolituus sp. ST750PaO-4 TaxID=2742965 RepID=UPI000C63F7F6|nr:phosphate regulon transcriptional regulator PhoB [Thalassolituus sp. ST750PaO-4]MAY13723.1 phosphate regulon transcriptional regulatory protein PhoB [Oceanospirillaceae bacterium]MCA6058914.1 phosphate regulon transcriptional regulator PhoB [Thalassolituus sp. ST750PaO-4]PIQ40144.1 MAG: phosphate regulon transcriptional regulatory protein PhoB [Thalassolituus sp. CG17_big_fil_post_rev_8_21_14_2_50_53_8]